VVQHWFTQHRVLMTFTDWATLASAIFGMVGTAILFRPRATICLRLQEDSSQRTGKSMRGHMLADEVNHITLTYVPCD
jgi:hypothetical protein